MALLSEQCQNQGIITELVSVNTSEICQTQKIYKTQLTKMMDTESQISAKPHDHDHQGEDVLAQDNGD